ncbi:MAG: hypothetical protein JST06_06265 [Bacteroidetes bacterium]|nr:hypothetical protein [Bacteroidota bacterium]
MRRLFSLMIACSLFFVACKKDDSNPGGGGGGSLPENTMRYSKTGVGDSSTTFNNITCGTETNSVGTFWSVRAFFDVGGPAYDRLSVAWKTEPAAGDYNIQSFSNYGNLPTGIAASNLTFRGYNNSFLNGTVRVSESGGKKKISFENLVFYYSNGGVSDSMKIATSVTCN